MRARCSCRGGQGSSSRRNALAPSDQLTLNLTAKTYRYLDEGETAPDAEADDGGKKGKTRREREQEKKT